jgi:hypothetical protein
MKSTFYERQHGSLKGKLLHGTKENTELH